MKTNCEMKNLTTPTTQEVFQDLGHINTVLSKIENKTINAITDSLVGIRTLQNHTYDLEKFLTSLTQEEIVWRVLYDGPIGFLVQYATTDTVISKLAKSFVPEASVPSECQGLWSETQV